MVCGLALDVCVAWTALDAREMGFETVLLRDLTRPVTEVGATRTLDEREVVQTAEVEVVAKQGEGHAPPDDAQQRQQDEDPDHPRRIACLRVPPAEFPSPGSP